MSATYTIHDAWEKGLIKKGARVRTNGDIGIPASSFREGVIMCVHATSFCLSLDGAEEGAGCRGSWSVTLKNRVATIQFLGADEETTILDHLRDYFEEHALSVSKAKPMSLSVSKAKPMSLSKFARRILDADTRLMHEAGLISRDLELTPTGSEELVAILFEVYREKMVARATEIIAERKSR